MSSRPWMPFLSLFASFGTLICCALPATFVALGAGATLASLLGEFPQLIWFSQNKELAFGVSALFISLGYLNMWLTRNAPCPIDPKLARACTSGKKISKIVLIGSTVLFFVGAFFAFVLG